MRGTSSIEKLKQSIACMCHLNRARRRESTVITVGTPDTALVLQGLTTRVAIHPCLCHVYPSICESLFPLSKLCPFIPQIFVPSDVRGRGVMTRSGVLPLG